MTRRLLTLISTVMLAVSFLGTAAWSQSTRARLLSELKLSTNAQLAPKVKAALSNSPSDVKLLALDLIVFRWTAHSSDATSDFVNPDVKNIDAIIRVINRESADPLLRWAEKAFDTSSKSAISPPPPNGDKRGETLVKLKENFANAREYEESQPVTSSNDLKVVLDSCVELQIEITEAQAISKLGYYYLYRATQFEQAQLCFDRAAWLFATYGCMASNAKVLDDLGLLNLTNGKYATAADNYKLSAQQWLQLAAENPSDYRHLNMAGQQFLKAGDALIRKGEPDKGLQMMRIYGLHELQLWAYPTKSYASLIANRIKVAGLYRDRNEISNAMDQLRQARKESELCGDPLLKARIFSELAKTYAADDNQAEAAAMTKEATRVLKSAASDGDAAISKLIKGPGSKELLQKAENGAVAYKQLENLQKAADIWKALAGIYQRLGSVDQRIASLESLATIYDERHQPAESLIVRRDAAIYAWQAKKVTRAAEIVQGIVQALIDIGDLQNALEGFTELMPIIDASGDIRGAAYIRAARGLLLASNGQPVEAIKYLQDARSRYIDPNQVGDAWAAADVSLQLASAQVAAGRPDEARSLLDSTVKAIEQKFTGEIVSANADSKHSQTLQSLYHDLVSLDITAGKPDDATRLIERAAVRYMWSLELINRLKKSSNPTVAKFASEAAGKIGWSSHENQTGPNTRQELIAHNWGEFSETCWMLRKQQCTVAYNALPVNPLDLFRLRSRLPADAAVVIYLVADNTLYAFVCSRSQAVCWRLGSSAASVSASVVSLRRNLEDCERTLDSGVPIPPINDWNSPSFTSIAKPLSELYSQLIDPIRDSLAGKRMLVFAMPDELMGVPMHALVRYQDNSQPRFLIQDYQVSYLSEGMLDSFVSRDSTTIDPVSDRLVIMADPENNLPGAQNEAKTIKAIYANAKWYLGDKATISSFINESRTAGLVHIAAHQVIDLNPTRSFTLLLAPDATSAGSLGLQELSKVQNDKLKLVVLSACNVLSSSDPISSGASRAAEVFAEAGAKSVMGGLWKVSDQAASGLMADFYRQITKKWPKAEALQYAQMRMIQSGEFAHPFYWACFALHGSPW